MVEFDLQAFLINRFEEAAAFFVVRQLNSAGQPFPTLTVKTDDVHNIGSLLFSNLNLPFQIIGVLVLVATIGVVVLSKRELR